MPVAMGKLDTSLFHDRKQHVHRVENRVVVVVHNNGRVRPPKESLGERSSVIDFHINFQISFVRMKCKSLHSFRIEHTLYFIAPDRFTTVCIFFNHTVGR